MTFAPTVEPINLAMQPVPTITRPLTRLCWGTLAFLMGVILWGSFVRASGSGAGCGNHWPLCNGVMIPESTSWKTVVEFTHRISSGLSIVLCSAIGVVSVLRFPKKSFVRRAGLATVFFIFSEAIIGAALVLLRLVEQDQSHLRAFSLAIHLINTFFLLAAVVLTARWSAVSPQLHFRKLGKGLAWASGFAIFLALLLGASGAITALGDTLFPAATLQAGFQQDLLPTKSFLIELRILHPFFAVLVSIYFIGFARFVLDPSRRRLALHAWAVLILQCTQLTLGVLNLLLLAPLFIQMSHLFVADLIWINLILLLSEVWVSKI